MAKLHFWTGISHNLPDILRTFPTLKDPSAEGQVGLGTRDTPPRSLYVIGSLRWGCLPVQSRSERGMHPVYSLLGEWTNTTGRRSGWKIPLSGKLLQCPVKPALNLLSQSLSGKPPATVIPPNVTGWYHAGYFRSWWATDHGEQLLRPFELGTTHTLQFFSSLFISPSLFHSSLLSTQARSAYVARWLDDERILKLLLEIVTHFIVLGNTFWVFWTNLQALKIQASMSGRSQLTPWCTTFLLAGYILFTLWPQMNKEYWMWSNTTHPMLRRDEISGVWAFRQSCLCKSSAKHFNSKNEDNDNDNYFGSSPPAFLASKERFHVKCKVRRLPTNQIHNGACACSFSGTKICRNERLELYWGKEISQFYLPITNLLLKAGKKKYWPHQQSHDRWLADN